MINKNRIVPVQATDLLSLYRLILAASSTSKTCPVVEATEAAGRFEIAASNATSLLNEPVKSINFASDARSFPIWFVFDYDFEGFTVNGVAAAVNGSPDIDFDGVTLYQAVNSGNGIVLTKALN